MFHFMMCLFQFMAGITFKWDVVLYHIDVLLLWIGIWTCLSLYKSPTDKFKWFVGFISNGGSI